MKKLITILTIMIVLVGSVFAVEPYNDAAKVPGTAAIDITATVSELFPVYQLAVNTGAGAQTSRNVGNGAEAIVIDEGVVSQKAAMNTNLVNALTAGNTAAVVFDIKQISQSRCEADFQMVVTASKLVRVQWKDAAGDTQTRTFEDALDEATTEETFTQTVAIAHDFTYADSTTIGTLQSEPTDKIVAKYTGKTITATDSVIGTATVTWNGNQYAKPGEYEARVLLTVSAL